MVRGDGDRFLPGLGCGEEGTVNAALRQNVVDLFFSFTAPTLMPGHDLIGPGGHIGKFVASTFVGYGIVKDAEPPSFRRNAPLRPNHQALQIDHFSRVRVADGGVLGYREI